jgi:hypothetical protein
MSGAWKMKIMAHSGFLFRALQLKKIIIFSILVSNVTKIYFAYFIGILKCLNTLFCFY